MNTDNKTDQDEFKSEDEKEHNTPLKDKNMSKKTDCYSWDEECKMKKKFPELYP